MRSMLRFHHLSFGGQSIDIRTPSTVMILVVAEKSCKSLGLMDQTTNIAALDDRYNVFIYLVETTIKFEELTGH